MLASCCGRLHVTRAQISVNPAYRCFYIIFIPWSRLVFFSYLSSKGSRRSNEYSGFIKLPVVLYKNSFRSKVLVPLAFELI